MDNTAVVSDLVDNFLTGRYLSNAAQDVPRHLTEKLSELLTSPIQRTSELGRVSYYNVDRSRYA